MTFLDQINANNNVNNSRSPLGMHYGSASPSTNGAPPGSALQMNSADEGTSKQTDHLTITDLNYPVDPGARRQNNRMPMPEDQMFEDLEHMLGQGAPSLKPPKLARRGSSSRIVPMNDLDDLDDFNQFEDKRVKRDVAPKRNDLPPLPSGPPTGKKNVFKGGLSDDLDD